MSKELKSCPICGKEAHATENIGYSRRGYAWSEATVCWMAAELEQARADMLTIQRHIERDGWIVRMPDGTPVTDQLHDIVAKHAEDTRNA